MIVIDSDALHKLWSALPEPRKSTWSHLIQASQWHSQPSLVDWYSHSDLWKRRWAWHNIFLRQNRLLENVENPSSFFSFTVNCEDGTLFSISVYRGSLSLQQRWNVSWSPCSSHSRFFGHAEWSLLHNKRTAVYMKLPTKVGTPSVYQWATRFVSARLVFKVVHEKNTRGVWWLVRIWLEWWLREASQDRLRGLE